VTTSATLYLRVVRPDRTNDPTTRAQTEVRGDQVWSQRTVTYDVPNDAVYVLFGVRLTGPGEIALRDVRLSA